MFWIAVVLALCSLGNAVTIGKIDDYIIIGTVYQSLSNLTYDQCVCQMMQLNGVIVALNYWSTNQSCQLFNFNISSILIESNVNSTLTFINQSAISITTIQSYRLPISSFATMTASNFAAVAGSPIAQADGLIDRVNTTDGTYFNSGGYPPQYVQLQLAQKYNIKSVSLEVAQLPMGPTQHLLYVGSDLNNLTLAANLSGVTSNGQWINLTFNPSLTDVQYLRLSTISSPSWVAWVKFIVYDY